MYDKVGFLAPKVRAHLPRIATRETSGMSSAIDSAKGAVSSGKEKFAEAQQRWPLLKHILDTVTRYGERRGNPARCQHRPSPASWLIPVLMVAFAIAGYVLAGNQEWPDKIQDSVVEQMPGDMGSQVSDLIDSAISSAPRSVRSVCSVPAFTGVGWMSGVRMALTECGAAASNATRCWPSWRPADPSWSSAWHSSSRWR